MRHLILVALLSLLACALITSTCSGQTLNHKRYYPHNRVQQPPLRNHVQQYKRIPHHRQYGHPHSVHHRPNYNYRPQYRYYPYYQPAPIIWYYPYGNQLMIRGIYPRYRFGVYFGP